jgi:hypothetical protein
MLSCRNPGSPVAKCLENTMDTLLTFESSYDTYTQSYQGNNWTNSDPGKIWHIVYGVPENQISNVAALARQRGAGLLEVTSDSGTNPYDSLPAESYMSAALSAVAGGKPPIQSAPKLGGSYVAGVPSDLSVTESDYTSVTLQWSSVANALGYAVYMNGAQVLELPPGVDHGDNRATVAMLDPGISGLSFEVRTLLSSGGGGSSRTVSASTMPLPKNGSIIDVGFTQSGDDVTYTATVLVPFAFVRLFISGPVPDDWTPLGDVTGWPISVPGVDSQGVAHFQMVNWLMEGNAFHTDLLQYVGGWAGGSAPAQWSWDLIRDKTVKLEQAGYTYTWKVNLGGTNAVPSEFVVQGEGYAPIQNVFTGKLLMYQAI